MSKGFTVRTIFRNFGMIKDFSQISENTRILLIQGPNEKGKTTIRTAFNEAFTGLAIKKEPVTKGQDEGDYEISITGPDGKEYIIKHDFNKFDSKGRFSITDPTGKTYKTTTKLRELLGNYNSLSIDDIFNLTRTAEGTRRFIKEFIEPQIDPKLQAKIDALTEQLKPGKGELYIGRTEANTRLKDAKVILEASKELTADELKELDKYDEVITALDKLKSTPDKNKEAIETNKLVEIELQSHNEFAGAKVERFDNDIQRENEALGTLELDLAKLQERIKLKEKDLAQLENERKAYLIKDKELITQIKVKTVVIEGKVVDNTESIARGEAYVDRLDTLKAYKDAYEHNSKVFTDRTADVEVCETAINKAIKQKKDLLGKAKLPNGLEVDSDTGKVTFKGLEFTDTEVSESVAKICIGELKCKMESAVLLDMGDFRTYGEKKLQEIFALAEKYNKLVIMESVKDDTENIEYINVVANDPTEPKE